MIWCSATLRDDAATKRRLWSGVFDDELDAFAAGGPDDSPDAAFVALSPRRALLLSAGGGRQEWRP